MKRICLILAILVLPALIFIGCKKKEAVSQQPAQAAAQGGYIRYAWWGNTVRDERSVQLSQLFMQKNPGVTVETEPTGWDGYWSKLNTQAAAGSLPDVMQQDVAYIKQYTERNQLEDLMPYSQRGIINLSNWGDLAAGTVYGKLTGLVIGTNAWGIGVDMELLKKNGIALDDTTWTWADYERIALEVYQKTGVKTVPVASTYTQLLEHITRQFSTEYGTYSVDDKSLGLTNNPQAQAAYKACIEMDLRLKAAGALINPDDAFIIGLTMEESQIALGNAWNGFYWSNQHVGHQTAAKRPLEYFMFPTVEGPRAPWGHYYRAGQYISLLSSSSDKDLSAKFIDFFCNDFEANRILLAERGIPIPTDVRADLAGRVDADMKYLFDYITRIGPFISPANPPYPQAAGESQDMIRPIMLQVLNGQITPDAAMTQMIQAANEVLGR